MHTVVEDRESEKPLTAAERAYLDALFQEAYPKLYKAAARHLHNICLDSVEDVIQETFLRACRQFHEMVRCDAPEAWLVSVCHHAAVDEVRRYNRISELYESSGQCEIDTASDSIDEILPPGISPRDHEILVRHYVYKDTSDEIGKDQTFDSTTTTSQATQKNKKRAQLIN